MWVLCYVGVLSFPFHMDEGPHGLIHCFKGTLHVVQVGKIAMPRRDVAQHKSFSTAFVLILPLNQQTRLILLSSHFSPLPSAPTPLHRTNQGPGLQRGCDHIKRSGALEILQRYSRQASGALSNRAMGIPAAQACGLMQGSWVGSDIRVCMFEPKRHERFDTLA